MDYLMAVGKNLVYPFFLRSCGVFGVGFELTVGVVEDSVAPSLTYIKGLSIPGIYESVHVIFQLVVDRWRKRLYGVGHHFFGHLPHALEDCGDALASAYAHCDEAEVLVSKLDLLEQLDRHDRASGSDRVAEADAAAVDVGLV